MLRNIKTSFKYVSCIAFFLTALIGCGGGGGGGGGNSPPPTQPPINSDNNNNGGGNPPPSTQQPTSLVANAGSDATVNAGDTLELKAGGMVSGGSCQWSRLEGPSVTLTAVDLPACWFTFTAPSTGTEDSITITYRLTIGNAAGQTAEDTVTFTILRVNQTPTADAGADQTVLGTEAVTLSGAGEDPDGVIASYLWEQIDGEPVTLANADSAEASFTAPSTLQDLQLTFRLTVTDNDGVTAEDTLLVVVTPEDAPLVDLHFPPAAGSYSGSSISAFGTVMAIESEIVSVTVDAGAGPVTATLEDDGRWRLDDISLPDEASYQLIITATDDLGRVGTRTSSLTKTITDLGRGPRLASARAMVIDPEANTAYVATASSTVHGIVPVDLATGNRGALISDWTDADQGPQDGAFSHMVFDKENNTFYLSTSPADEDVPSVILSVDKNTGQRELISGGEKGTGEELVRPVGLALGPQNTLYVSDNGGGRILAVDTVSGHREVIADESTDDYNVQGALRLVWDDSAERNNLYVVINSFSGHILNLDLSQSPVTSSLLTSSQQNGPSIGMYAGDVVLDTANDRLILLTGLYEILAIDIDGGERTPIADEVTLGYRSSLTSINFLGFDDQRGVLYALSEYLAAAPLWVIDPLTGNKVALSY